MKKRVSAVLCAAIAVGAGWTAPTVARAGDIDYMFDVYAWDERVIVTSPDNLVDVPKGLKAYVRKKESSTPLATLTHFTRKPETCANCPSDPHPSVGDFQSDPVKLPELGEYTIDLEYTGTEGETILHKDMGVLDYKVRPVFSNLKTTAISMEHLDTVISGDLSVYNPVDGSSKPYAGGAFTTRQGYVTTPQTADAKGHFEAKYAVAGGDFVDDPQQDPVMLDLAVDLNDGRDRERVVVPVTPVEATIKLDAPILKGAYGLQGKITGTATWKSADGTWKPVPAGLWVNAPDWDLGYTDASGRFALSSKFRRDGVVNLGIDTLWVVSKSAVTVDTTGGTAFSGFAASVDASKAVRVSGAFERGEIPAGTTSLKVEIQYSADGKTGWTTRRAFDVPTKPGANEKAAINQTLPYPGAPGYVRLRYVGTPAIHGAVTPAVRIGRTMTAIPEFNATPEPAKKGKPITLTGKLNHRSPDWKPFAGQRIDYYFRAAGSTTWTAMGSSTTTADGTFTKSFTAARTGSWQARYVAADTTHFIATSREDEVVVTP